MTEATRGAAGGGLGRQAEGDERWGLALENATMIDRFMQDFDPYEYANDVEDAEAEVLGLARALADGRAEAEGFLRVVLVEAEDAESYMHQEAKAIVAKLSADGMLDGNAPAPPSGQAMARVTQDELDAMVEAHTGRRPMDLSGLDASGLWVVGRDLRNAVFDGANLDRCHILSCMLERASFQGASLRGADLSCSHAQDLDLTGADLAGADLHGIDLTGAGLVGANLSGADLRMAKLSFAALLDTDLAGADVADAVIDADNLGLFGGAVGLDRAIMIDPTARPQEGPKDRLNDVVGQVTVASGELANMERTARMVDAMDAHLSMGC